MSSSNDEEQKPTIVIASNRGPFAFSKNEDGTFSSRRGAGGLVTALGALAERLDVRWVAAALSDDDREWAKQNDNQLTNVEGIYLRLVNTPLQDYDNYYNKFANPLLWFIQHQMWELPRNPSITKDIWEAWESYKKINKLFAETIAKSIEDETGPVFVFPQDYHFYLVPYYLRELVGDTVQIQPFLHIPWPGPDAWQILPSQMRTELLKGLLASDRVGFQTRKDAFNFVQTCRFYLPNAHSKGSRVSIYYDERKVDAKTYPISVDVEKLTQITEQTEVQLLKSQLLQYIGGRKLILRVDRIEPSKNILRGLQAYKTLLDNYPEYHRKVQMLALLVPSRMEIDYYQDYLKEIMAEGGMINAEYSDELWEPVRIIVGENYHRAIAAMQLYDILLVNPIADGMNLVAKEGAYVNEKDGVLLLSENAGVFYELGDHALTISPYDDYGAAEAMHQALTMPVEERHERAIALRQLVESSDIKRWFQTQFDDAVQAFESQPKNRSTSKTPSKDKSAESKTTSGVSSDRTAKAKPKQRSS